MSGKEGCNIPGDLWMEKLNRIIKDVIQHLGANKTEKAIERVSRCAQLISTITTDFDNVSGLHIGSGAHIRASETSDVEKLVVALNESMVFDQKAQRSHRTFSNFRSNHLVRSLNKSALFSWMEELFGPPKAAPILFLLSPEVSGTSGTMSIYIYIYICNSYSTGKCVLAYLLLESQGRVQ